MALDRGSQSMEHRGVMALAVPLAGYPTLQKRLQRTGIDKEIKERQTTLAHLAETEPQGLPWA
jgi:type II secretory pathway predicted ATPase ExeA